MSEHRRDGERPTDERTVPTGRPLGTSEVAPDAIFDRFVANAYRGATPGAAGPVSAAPLASTLEHEARWIATVEELLDDGEVTEVGARPVIRVADVPGKRGAHEAIAAETPSEDTDVTRAVVHPARAPRAQRPPSSPVPAPSLALAEAASSDAVTARHKPVVLDAPAAYDPPAPEPAPAPAPAREPAPVPSGVPAHDHTLRIVLLNKRKAPSLPPPAPTAAMPPLAARQELESPAWKSLVRAPSATTQRREALLVVPEVAKVEAAPTPMPEGSEDGMMPGGELDRKLGDMAVLLRYGHDVQVRREIDTLQAQYPRDLLMLRRIAEFWVATGRSEPACELLFALATGLFERRNVEGMRQALEQVLVLSPGNERAMRLVALLEQRPGALDR